jgi:ATP-dependent helicase/DNAse subunit B
VAILDYKSGGRRFESVKFDNGLELQMPAYLNAICANDGARRLFRARTLQPAGVFYVGLRARPESGPSRSDAAARGADAEASAFQHLGRFDASLVERFDNRCASKGDQFKYSFNKNGSLGRRGNDAMPAEQFNALLECATQQVRQLADRILSGATEVSPYQQGSSETACDYCELRPVCRFDAWTQCYRPLKRQPSRLATREGDA